MLVALADTHSREDPRLTDHLRETVAAADCALHAGDFTTATVLDAFGELAGRFVAARGNSDDATVRARLPDVGTVEALGRRFLVVHGHEHDRTARVAAGVRDLRTRGWRATRSAARARGGNLRHVSRIGGPKRAESRQHSSDGGGPKRTGALRGTGGYIK